MKENQGTMMLTMVAAKMMIISKWKNRHENKVHDAIDDDDDDDDDDDLKHIKYIDVCCWW